MTTTRGCTYLLSILLLALSCWPAQAGSSEEERSLSPQLEAFRPYLGKTYRGTFADSTPAKPMVDVQRWERALNGAAVRVMHSINDGAYGGETLFFWDSAREQLRYYYFTTAGFYTEGSARFDGNRFESHEHVTGNNEGVTEVKASAWFADDGSLKVESVYLKGDEKVGGREVTYQVDPEAKVILR